MDQLADQLVVAAGTALVNAMASRSWEDARTAMIELWRRVHKDKIPQLESDLDKLHSDMMDARTSEDTEREEILAAIWSTRFIQLIRKNSDLIPYLQALLDEHLIPALPPGAAGEVRNPVINARASGWSRQNIAGRDLHVNGS